MPNNSTPKNVFTRIKNAFYKSSKVHYALSLRFIIVLIAALTLHANTMFFPAGPVGGLLVLLKVGLHLYVIISLFVLLFTGRGRYEEDDDDNGGDGDDDGGSDFDPDPGGRELEETIDNEQLQKHLTAWSADVNINSRS